MFQRATYYWYKVAYSVIQHLAMVENGAGLQIQRLTLRWAGIRGVSDIAMIQTTSTECQRDYPDVDVCAEHVGSPRRRGAQHAACGPIQRVATSRERAHANAMRKALLIKFSCLDQQVRRKVKGS